MKAEGKQAFLVIKIKFSLLKIITKAKLQKPLKGTIISARLIPTLLISISTYFLKISLNSLK